MLLFYFDHYKLQSVILLADVKVYNLMFKQCYFYVLQGTFSTQFYFWSLLIGKWGFKLWHSLFYLDYNIIHMNWFLNWREEGSDGCYLMVVVFTSMTRRRQWW